MEAEYRERIDEEEGWDARGWRGREGWSWWGVDCRKRLDVNSSDGEARRGWR